MEVIWTINTLSIVLLALMLALMLISIIWGQRPYRKAACFPNPHPYACDESKIVKVSIVVYAQCDEEMLMNTLEQINNQDYADYETIVVCDASQDYAEMIREKVASTYSNMYVTFIQPGSHNLSRRKLAITIGVKAAKGEVVVTIPANARIPSERWLTEMMIPFTGEQGRHIDVSLGLSKMDFAEMKGLKKWYRQFDSVLTNALWIGYAAEGKPYRGDGYNLAFRRALFFEHKGYAKTINLHNGDDDLFINEISTSANTKVTVSADTILTTVWGESANRVWSIRKERYSFTARWLPKMPFAQSTINMSLQWMIAIVAGVVIITGYNTLIPALCAILLLLIYWGEEIWMYRRLATRFGVTRLWWGVVPFWMWRPIGDMLFRYEHMGSRKKNFTWQR